MEITRNIIFTLGFYLLILFIVGLFYNRNIEKKIISNIEDKLKDSDYILVNTKPYLKYKNNMYVFANLRLKIDNPTQVRKTVVIYKINDDYSISEVDEPLNTYDGTAKYSSNFMKLKYNINIH